MEKFERPGYKAEDLEIKSQAELEDAKLLVAKYQKAIEKYETSKRGPSGEFKENEEKEKALVEKIKEKVYKELEERGRLSHLARIGDLENLLKKEAPGFNLEIIRAMDNKNDQKENLWQLAGFVTPDRKSIYVIPSFDFIVGPGEVLDWFDGGRHYDGTQNLGHSDEVKKMAKGEWDSRLERWVPKEKGIIRTRYEQSH